MPRPTNQPVGSIDTLHASAARTASGSGATMGGFDKVTWVRVQLNVTAVSGTTPTLDVVVEDTLDGVNWNTVGSFAQVTAVGRQVVNFSAPFADRIRVRYTVGGTSPSFTFAVLAYSQ